MMLTLSKYRKFKTARGVAAVEFTLLIAFVFAPLVLGTIEVGRVLYQYNSVAKSVRDSARYISLYSATGPGYAAKVTIAKCLAAFGNTGCTGNPIAPGLTAAKVFIGTDGSGTPLSAGSAGTVVLKLITVRVSGYQLSYVTKIFVNGGSKAFNDISVTMRQATT
jgi:Flp pilus assembly protein TadG